MTQVLKSKAGQSMQARAFLHPVPPVVCFPQGGTETRGLGRKRPKAVSPGRLLWSSHCQSVLLCGSGLLMLIQRCVCCASSGQSPLLSSGKGTERSGGLKPRWNRFFGVGVFVRVWILIYLVTQAGLMDTNVTLLALPTHLFA